MPRATLSRAKAAKAAKPKKPETPVAPKSKTFVMFRPGSDGYGYSSNVKFYGAGAVKKVVKLSASRIKEIASTLLAGRKPSDQGPSGNCLGSTCFAAVKSVLGLCPKAGHVYLVTATYKVEDVTKKSHAEAQAMVTELEKVIVKHTPKATPKAKAKKKTVKKAKTVKKTARSKARKLNRYVAP